jgi:hypothetical protein
VFLGWTSLRINNDVFWETAEQLYIIEGFVKNHKAHSLRDT